MSQDENQPLANGTRNLADEDLTQAVLATFSISKSERYQQIMQTSSGIFTPSSRM